MKKAFFYSLLVHIFLVIGIFFFIKAPQNVEIVTIPLNMSSSLEMAKSTPNKQKAEEEILKESIKQVKEEILQRKFEEAPKVVEKVKESKKEPTQTKKTVVSKKAEIKKEKTILATLKQSSEAKVSDEINENIQQTQNQKNEQKTDNLESTNTKNSSNSIEPNLKANFEIIRKKTYEKLYYPKFAQNALKEGVATLIFKLNENGLIEEIELEQSTGYSELDKIVLKAASSLQGDKLNSLGKKINIRLEVEFLVPNKKEV